MIVRLKSFFLHAAFLGVLFGFLGWFLVNYGFIHPADSSISNDLTIEATGQKDNKSKSSEVWFYGAYLISDGRRISWTEFDISPSWERRDEIYVSYKNQPCSLRLISSFNEPLRLDFGSHSYSGLIQIKWQGNIETIDLYSKNNDSKSVIITPGQSYRYSNLYFIIILVFVCIGFFIAIPATLCRGSKVYYGVFASWLLFSIYISLATFYPGVYTNDSTAQLRQAIVGSYNDWHPPAMAWFWSVLILITGQIESLMIFHLLILAGGAFYWARILEHIGCGVFAFIIPVILASPVIVNFSGVIWKDVGFAYVLLLASGIAGVAILNKRIYSFQFLAIVFLLAYGFGVRSNGIFAIIPIVIFVAWLMIAKANSKLSKIDIFCRISISTIAFVAILIVGMQYCVYDLLGSEKRYPIQYLELYDIAGVSSISKYDFFPEYVRQAGGYSIYRIKEEYEKSISVYGNANNIFFSSSADGAPPLILLNVDAVLQTQLRNSWLEAIIAEPIAYLKHRLSVFSFLMEKGFYSHEMPQDDASRVSVLKANMLDLKIIKFKNIHFPGVDGAKRFVLISFLWSQGAYIYNGWVWLSLLLVEFFLGLTVFGKTSLGRIVVMTSSSGLLYLLPYFIVAPASDFRYLYWTSIAASFTFLLVFAYVMKLLTRLISWQYVGLAKG